MRKATACRLTLALLPFVGAAGFVQAAADKANVSIEFLSDGRCTVAGHGEGFHAAMTYTPKSAGDAYELRCAMPPVPVGRRVDLTVVLPAGRRPSGSGGPSLSWKESNGRWRGTASLTEAPDVVVVEDWNSPRAARSRLGTRAALVGGTALAAFGAIAVLRKRHPVRGVRL